LFEFTQPDERLRIGMAAKAQVFAGAAREVVAVPASAVLDENGMATVFVMIGGESFERRQVRIGARDGDWVEVVEGLEAGAARGFSRCLAGQARRHQDR
jgi:cobalt-zinc-cadmium efflux system membrane fusion protein